MQSNSIMGFNKKKIFFETPYLLHESHRNADTASIYVPVAFIVEVPPKIIANVPFADPKPLRMNNDVSG